MSVSLRLAEPQDADLLGVLRRSLFEEIDPPRWSAEAALAFTNASIAGFDRGIRDGWCHAWLAEDDSRNAIGATALLIFPRLPSPAALWDEEGYLLNVYTDPAWRGQGIARALVSAAIEHARTIGLVRIRLHATSGGRKVYTALGFRGRDDEMELWLSPKG